MAKKALDLRRDARFALHSGSEDPEAWKGDAKVAGVVEEVTDPDVRAAVLTQAPPGPSHLFRADIAELVVVTLSRNRKNLVIEAWHPERGVTRYQR